MSQVWKSSMRWMKVSDKSYYKVSDTKCHSKASQQFTLEGVRDLSADS